MVNKSKLGEIKQILQGQVEAEQIAGANVLIYRNGAEQYYCECGYADKEAGVPIQRDTIFRIFSMTKPITAAACLLLVEEGKLDLLDPVSKYLPGFRCQTVSTPDGKIPVRREVTIKDLLGMTSGMPYKGDSQAGCEAATVWQDVERQRAEDYHPSTREIANRLGECSLLFHPGDAWEYGSSADVMGAVIEAASGQNFGEYLQERFFQPLDMKDTAFYVSPEKQPQLALVYSCTPYGMERVTEEYHLGINMCMDKPNPYQSGGGGLSSTVDDYMKFAQMLLNKGLHGNMPILAPKTVEFLTTPQLTDKQRRGIVGWEHLCGYSYGNFMRIMTDPGKAAVIGSYGEYGWDGLLGTYFANFPDKDATFLLMLQRMDPRNATFPHCLRNIMMSALDS